MRIRDCPRHEGADCVRSINEANDLLRASVIVSGLVALVMAAVVGPTGTLIDSALALPTSAIVVVWLCPGFTGQNMMDPLYLVREDINAIRRRTTRARLSSFRTTMRMYAALGFPLHWYATPILELWKILILNEHSCGTGIGRGGVTCLTVHRVKEMCKVTSPRPEGLVI